MSALSVVRRFGSDRTHVMAVTSTTWAVVFGADYRRPADGVAACGVSITDGVVMRAGAKVRCSACKHVTGLAEQAPP